MSIFDWIMIITQLVPMVVNAIKIVEAPGNGPLKRDTVIATVLAGLNASLQLAGKAPLTDQQITMLRIYIGLIVDSFVSLFNRTGQFQASQTVVVQPK